MIKREPLDFLCKYNQQRLFTRINAVLNLSEHLKYSPMDEFYSLLQILIAHNDYQKNIRRF